MLPAPWLYWLLVIALEVGSLWLFRVRTRREYRERGRLSAASSLLELALWLAYAAIPFIYNPPCWPYVWACAASSRGAVALAGYLLIAGGALIGFGSMIWLGLQRSFGHIVGELMHAGPYRFSRNPQVLGGTLMVTGVALLWPSWMAAGWALLWVGMFHPMVLTEEEHLRRNFAADYERYSRSVPRYFGWPRPLKAPFWESHQPKSGDRPLP